MAITIRLDHKDFAKAVEVRAMAERITRLWPELGGADILIERDDSTSVECGDEILGAQILSSVRRAIDGETS